MNAACRRGMRVFAGRGALPRDRRRTSQNRSSMFSNPTSVMTGEAVFIFFTRATPVAQERAPTASRRRPGRCTGQPAAHANSTGSGVLRV